MIHLKINRILTTSTSSSKVLIQYLFFNKTLPKISKEGTKDNYHQLQLHRLTYLKIWRNSHNQNHELNFIFLIWAKRSQNNWKVNQMVVIILKRQSEKPTMTKRVIIKLKKMIRARGWTLLLNPIKVRVIVKVEKLTKQ